MNDTTVKKLVRTKNDRMIAGVCGGLARYAGLDPVLVRLLMVGLVLFGGSGVLLYLAGWIIIPEEETPL
ncbi:PspC domain-containing protein [Thermasporomyces composti]|jgi:phage shock protein C|uniref:Phage shock protein C (PspC) family protein n=1 Tax=Thermasporomyces composti TaxID=696763 RepID=A0A3D9V6J8_THECX|nr:PspC domain-containing protein [Thermasporomyces composti]REF37398.1 phage shock protein C (PspC) family protein [Thermasporomyces composti]